MKKRTPKPVKQNGIIHKGPNGKYADPATVACRAVLRTLPY